MTKTKIEWTEKTWNVITGCTKYTEWCKNCYAEKMHNRIREMWTVKKYSQPFNIVKFYEEELIKPYNWKKPSIIFVNSMSDVFHQDISDEEIFKIIKVAKDNPHHKFQILTKRTKRMYEFLMRNKEELSKIDNIIWGTTIENNLRFNERFNFISELNNYYHTFISFEPLLDNIDFSNINWLKVWWFIVWWESWPWAREIKEEWVFSIKDYADKNNIPFMFKQWWGVNKKLNWCLLNWKEYKEFPEYLK